MTKIKKALLSVLCCFALIFCSAFVFTACTRVQNIRYEINVVQVENGELKVFGEPYAGNEITIQVVPNAGYEIVAGSLKVNGEKISTNKFLMPSKNVKISAQFKKITYSVDMPSYENGKLDIEVDGQKISSGDKLEWGKTVTIEILPDSGYALKNINVLKNDQQLAVNGSGNIRTFVMPQGNVTINATFEKITYTLTKLSEHGTFTIPATANTGETVQVTGITPATGYELDQILVDGVALEVGITSFTMPAKDVTVSVTFKNINYTITKSETTNGSFTVQETATYGENVTISVTPAIGYEFDQILVDGEALGVGITSFTMPAKDVTVSVTFKQSIYTITREGTVEHGTFEVQETAIYGEEVEITSNPDTSYKAIFTVMFNETPIAVVNNKFIMPAGNVTISATFVQNINSVIITTTTNGTVSANPVNAVEGSEVELTISPNTGYKLETLVVMYGETPVTVADNKFVMPAGDVTVSATFVLEDYIVSKSTEENGTYSLSKTVANYNDLIEIILEPNTGYELDQILVNGVALEVGVTSFTMPANDVTVSVTFKKINYIITKSETTNGSFTVQETATYGENVTISVTPATGYELDQILVDGVALEVGITSFTMPAKDVTVSVTFKIINYTITKNETTNGSFTVQETATYGENVTISVTPATGYELDQILVNGVALEVGVTSFTMPANDVTVSVIFKKINYIITKSETTNGSFTVQETATYGENVTISVTPATGYVLDQILVDGVALEVGITSFTMPAKDVTVSVTFKNINYTINKSETTNGSFTVQETATYGENVTVSVTPAIGYELDQILVDGEALEVGITSFTMPANNVAVSVTFKAINYTITKNSTTNGSFTVQETAIGGETITVTGNPNASYYFNDVLVEWEGGSLHAERTSETEFTFTMPSNNVTISCTFGETYVLGLYDVTYTTSGTDLTITKVTTSKTSYEIPATFMIGETTYNVVAIGDGTNCVDSDVESIILPEGLTVIKQSAFRGCTGLTSITIPSTVTGINTWAFSSCSNLKSISLSEGLKTISGGAFENCTSLTTIIIPSTVTSIGEYALNGCSKLEMVEFNSTTPPTVGNNVFYNCSKLTTITVPKGTKSAYVTALGEAYQDKIIEQLSKDDIKYTTSGRDLTITGVTATETSYAIPSTFVIGGTTYTVKSLLGTSSGGVSAGIDRDVVKVILPSTLTSIGNYAFYKCIDLTSVTIPDSVTSIGKCAFWGCTGLTSVTIPDSVTSIGLSVFNSCTGLTSITIPDSITIIDGYAFRGCTGLTSVEIPNSVTGIGDNAFWGCTGLKSVTIGSGVTSIGAQAFRDCTGLTSIEIPNSVTSIGNKAFLDCAGLTSVTFEGATSPTCGLNIFSYCTSLTTIYVPTGTKSAYVTALGSDYDYESKIVEKS